MYLRYPNAKFFIVDSENEYVPLVKAMGGEVVDISPVSETHFNPLDFKYNKDTGILPQNEKSEFVERFPELSLFYRLSSPLDSEMICIFPYFCPCEESAREIREFFIKHCSPLYQEVLRNPALLFLLSERRYSLWY